MDWITIWKVVLLASLALFAALTIVTSVLGARDVRSLFRRLEDERKDRE